MPNEFIMSDLSVSQNQTSLPGFISHDTEAWLSSPCSDCGTFCCSNLPVADLCVETRNDLSLLADICWFEGMIPVLKDNGEWRLFYHANCRRLHVESSKCLVHDMPEQSSICKNYSPHTCWYKRAFATAETKLLIRFNASRIHRLIELMTFDADGVIDSVPSWEIMQEMLAKIPFDRSPAPSSMMDDARKSPDLFLVPPGRPQSPEHLDLARFRFGFPGLMMLSSFSSWCFAIPALLRRNIPQNLQYYLRQRLRTGAFDALLPDLEPSVRYLLDIHAFTRIHDFSALSAYVKKHSLDLSIQNVYTRKPVDGVLPSG